VIIEKIGSRGVHFVFEEKDYPFVGNVSVYLINTADRLFLCDTHLGPDSMEHIKQYAADQFGEKEMVIFNSHADWDHIWGNCAFEDAIILGHETCRTRMLERGEYDLLRFPEYQRGKVRLKLPNLTFGSSIRFEEDGVEFIHTPGHTIDSAICFDRKDSVLFAGDLAEHPIPYLGYHDLHAYIKTLEFIGSLGAKVTISAHSGIIDNSLIDSNIEYIRSVLSNKPVKLKGCEGYEGTHSYNMKNIILMRYENIARERLGSEFDYKAFKDRLADFKNMDGLELEAALKVYIKEL
jgi:glyoxylase-like metal-dependent hydrolase (beta-lactamase superfamily II)